MKPKRPKPRCGTCGSTFGRHNSLLPGRALCPEKYQPGILSPPYLYYQEWR